MFGYTLIKKSELTKTVSSLEEACVENNMLNLALSECEFENKTIKNDNAKLHEENIKLSKLIEEQKQTLQELNSLINKERIHNSVTLMIDDDLISITPIVRTKPNAFETLFQNGYLTDAQNTQHAIELSFMTIANEALEQLISQFEEPVRGD